MSVLAQSYDAYLRWTQQLAFQANTEAAREEGERRHDAVWQPMRMKPAEEIAHSTAMADQSYRRFLATVKILNDLRRSPAVAIAVAGQVNIGTQQVNVGPAITETDSTKFLSKSFGKARRAAPRQK